MGLIRKTVALAVLSGMCSPVMAVNYDVGPFGISFTNRLSAGLGVRLEERDPALIAKLNLDPELCPDNCLSFDGNPDPNQRLVDAPGAFFGTAQDDGNLNYDQYDLVSALARITSDLTIGWGDLTLKARGIGFVDEINTGFSEFHANTDFQPRRTDRSEQTDELVGKSIELLDLFISGSFYVGDRTLGLSIGQQKVRWGEANLIALNSLSEINPIDARRFRQPGTQINEIFQPVPLALVSMDITPNILAEAFWQWRWKPVIPDPAGSFFADVDVLRRDDPYAIVGLGQFPEDPNGENRLAGLGAEISDTSVTAKILPEELGHPRDDGQYGVRVNWFAENVNNGTEFGFYAMNYHSRFPYLSVIATDESCLRDSPTFAQALADCMGFNGQNNASGQGLEPLPIDTLQVMIDYPEDISLYGLSFNTNLGAWSIAGEYSYRPNLPAQVSVADVVFAGLQPTFPRQDLAVGGTIPGLGGFSAATIPASRNAAPDFIETIYRGNEVQPNQYIPGYERLSIGQLSVTGIRIIGSSNPINAEQIIVLVEVGATQVFDLPSLDQVQFDGGSPNRTHYSPGADGTGAADGQPDSRTFNPTQQTDALVTDLAWGYRILSRLEYNDVFWGLNLKPYVALFHDVQGYGPTPMQSFLEGRLEWLVGTELEFGQRWSGVLQYNGHGGTRHNARRDRDNLSLSVAYTF